MKNRILYGFMGCGKSTVGAVLASLSASAVWDLDAYIEEKAGQKIPEIFAQQGEKAFRLMEREACAHFSRQSGQILCCGGGTVLDEENVRILGENGVFIFLDAPFSLCYDRIKNSDRPLVQEKDKEELARLFAKRFPVYEALAQIWVDASQSPEEIARFILTKGSL